MRVIGLICMLLVCNVLMAAQSLQPPMQSLVSILRTEEGFSATPYPDNSQMSIGYGLSVDWVNDQGIYTSNLSRSEASMLLKLRLDADLIQLQNKLTCWATLPNSIQRGTQLMYYRCPSMIGPNYTRLIQEGDWDSATREMLYSLKIKRDSVLARQYRLVNRIRHETGLSLIRPLSLHKHNDMRHSALRAARR